MYACYTVSVQDDCTLCQTSRTAEHCMFIKIWAVQESEGNILDDEVLINTLNNSKLTAGKQNLLLSCHDDTPHVIRLFLHWPYCIGLDCVSVTNSLYFFDLSFLYPVPRMHGMLYMSDRVSSSTSQSR